MDLTYVDEQIQDLELEVKPGESLTLRLAAFKRFPEANIRVNVYEGGVFHGAFADFSQSSGVFHLEVHLKSPLAQAYWYGASICGREKKIFDTNLYHEAKETGGIMENHGIVTKGGKLHFLGTSAINKGAKGSSTRQAAKIIIFDPSCDGRCAPILKIDENDVKASHAAIVGKLNDEHIFYLCSRGLSAQQAKRLITLGYLTPIEDHFEGELKEQIDAAIEGGI